LYDEVIEYAMLHRGTPSKWDDKKIKKYLTEATGKVY
jgi:hypothetical protein